MSFLREGLARLGSRRWKIGGTPVMCSLERCRQGLKNSSSDGRRNSPEREVRIPNVSKPSDLKTASTSWRPCRSVLAGQLVCSAKLSDQILWKDFEPIKANRPVIMATVGSCSADSRRFRRPDFRYRVREAAGRSSATGCFSKRRIDGA